MSTVKTAASSWPALFCTAALCWSSGLVQAQVQVSDAWARGTVPQQKSTGLYARILAAKGGRLVSASSPAAALAEIHEMKMDGTTMRMRALPQGLPLPAGKAVELKPGGYHVMLLDLKQQLKPGDIVAMTFVFEDADKKRETVEVKAAVRALASAVADPHKH